MRYGQLAFSTKLMAFLKLYGKKTPKICHSKKYTRDDMTKNIWLNILCYIWFSSILTKLKLLDSHCQVF